MLSMKSQRKYAIRALKHISDKILLKSLILWHCKSTFLSNLTPRKKLIIETSEEKQPATQRVFKSSPNSRIPRIDSPQGVGLRLFNKAQEIENHKNDLRKMLAPDYSFTPKLSTGTEKWLKSKSKKEIKPNEEEVAIVSGSKVLSFTKFDSNVKEMIDSKMPNTSNNKKGRIITSRQDRRSDIINRMCESPEKHGKVHNKSLSKY